MKAPQIDRRSTLGWLQAVMVLAVVLPVLAFAGAAAFLHRQAFIEATLQVDRGARIAEEHALKIFETNVALLNRAADLLGDAPDPALSVREPELHHQLKRVASDLPQLRGLFVIDATGRMLATNRMLPAPRHIDYSDREGFQHHRDDKAQPYVSALLTSRSAGQPFFELSLRRTLPDGGFGGTLSASMAPSYFADFYATLGEIDRALQVALLRSDGEVLARWPQAPSVSDTPAPAGLASAAVAAVWPRDSELSTTRRLATYPVHVRAWMDRSAVLAPWFRQILVLAALMFPTAIGLYYVAWVAQRKAREALAAAEELRRETSQREQVEEALRLAQKLEAMGRLTGGVAHDFNNLLTIVSNNVYLLQRRSPELAQSSAMAAIGRAVTAGSNLTRQLLSFSRRQPLHPETVVLQQRVPVIVELLKTAVGGTVELVTEVDAETSSIEVDVAELELALLNLAINARDAMPQGGQLRLGIANAAPEDQKSSAEPRVAITLRDTGHGIAPELLDRVFEPFYTTKAVGKGTGLGLSQVYGFCARAGGTVTIESHEGQGTVVSMLFPASAGKQRMAVDGKKALTERLDGLRILLVEDNEDVALATVGLLQSMGAAVLRLAGAESAQSHLQMRAGEFDVLLTDIVMPGSVNGIELARAARQAYPRLGILLMSGYSDFIEEATQLQLDVLSKPCAAATLAAALRASVERARARPSLQSAAAAQ